MPALMHQGLHILILLAFLAAIGIVFVAALAPLLFGDREGLALPRLRSAIVIALAALAGLGAEWLLHGWPGGR